MQLRNFSASEWPRRETTMEALELTDEQRAERREAFAFFLAFFAFPEAFVCAWDWNVEWVFLPRAHGFPDSFLWQSNLEGKVNEKRFKCLLADTWRNENLVVVSISC